jgi:hypothetical protein
MREISYISGVEVVLLVVFVLHICRLEGLHTECYPSAQREPIYTDQTIASAPLRHCQFSTDATSCGLQFISFALHYCTIILL